MATLDLWRLPAGIGAAGGVDPLGYPLRVRAAASGEIWFAGLATRAGGVAGPVIGRLDGGGNAATSWVLPALTALRVSDIGLQEQPQLIWFTLQLWNHHAAPGGAIPILGCLDPVSGDVTLWSRAPQPPAGVFHFHFGGVALAGNSPTSPKMMTRSPRRPARWRSCSPRRPCPRSAA